MTDIKYHPLVDADTDGMVKIPMFCAENEDQQHRFYLEEMIPHYFRLCFRKNEETRVTDGFSICCPYCGAELHRLSQLTDGTRNALYTCPRCK